MQWLQLNYLLEWKLENKVSIFYLFASNQFCVYIILSNYRNFFRLKILSLIWLFFQIFVKAAKDSEISYECISLAL